MNDTQQKQLLAHLLSRWKTISFFAAVGFAVAASYSLVATKWYESRLTVVPSQRSQEAALAAKLPSIGGLGASLSIDSQRIEAVLRSASVADEVITRFNLKEQYGTEHLEYARGALAEHCKTSVDKKSGVVTLACEDQNPQQAMAIAAYFGEVGNRIFARISASSAGEERKFLEEQVVKTRKDVDAASRRLREFQEKHKIVDLPEQSKAVISAMASIQGEMVSKQLQLSYLNTFSSRTESNVVQLQQQIGIMEAKLRQLEASHSLTKVPFADADPKFFPDALKVPALRFELEQLFREQKIQETVFFLMTQRYEMAKIDEARDTSTFQILDYPTLPSIRSRPKRKKMAAYGLAGGVAVGFAVVVLPFWLRRRFTTVQPTS